MSESPLLGVIQFQHPGPEHKVERDGTTPWNTGSHCRKFVRVNGRYVGAAGAISDGPLVCWTEWEAPSRLVQRLVAKPGHPRAVVEPIYSGPANILRTAQNTDPYIFGDRFLYTYCQQVGPTRWNSTRLSKLEPSSLILFGSHQGGKFILDTAFVVEDWVTHSRNTWQTELSNVVSPVYRSVTLEPMYADPIPPNVSFRLYRGASYAAPVHGMFSFFPCLPVGDGEMPSFARPSIHLDGIITPGLTQNRKATELPTPRIAEVWSEVVRQVRDQGLVLGVAADEPQLDLSP